MPDGQIAFLIGIGQYGYFIGLLIELNEIDLGGAELYLAGLSDKQSWWVRIDDFFGKVALLIDIVLQFIVDPVDYSFTIDAGDQDVSFFQLHVLTDLLFITNSNHLV